MNLRDMQARLPWGTHDYTSDFLSGVPHNHFGHAQMHIGKANGGLAEQVDNLDHGKPVDRAALEKYLADVVICAMRMANTVPGSSIDLEAAIITRARQKNGPSAFMPCGDSAVCICATIQMADGARHFKECPLRGGDVKAYLEACKDAHRPMYARRAVPPFARQARRLAVARALDAYNAAVPSMAQTVGTQVIERFETGDLKAAFAAAEEAIMQVRVATTDADDQVREKSQAALEALGALWAVM